MSSRVSIFPIIYKNSFLELFTLRIISICMFTLVAKFISFFALVTNNCISDHYINHNYNPECKHYRIESLCVWIVWVMVFHNKYRVFRREIYNYSCILFIFQLLKKVIFYFIIKQLHVYSHVHTILISFWYE